MKTILTNKGASHCRITLPVSAVQTFIVFGSWLKSSLENKALLFILISRNHNSGCWHNQQPYSSFPYAMG
jgi:hypothetical protein